MDNNPMPENNQDTAPIKPRLWLAICVGSLMLVGLKSLIPNVLMFAIRTWSHFSGDKALWMQDASDTFHWGWYVIQAGVFLGSVAAGHLAGRLSPRRTPLLPIGLITLNLLTTVFEQLPQPMELTSILIWVLIPNAGLLVGLHLLRPSKPGEGKP